MDKLSFCIAFYLIVHFLKFLFNPVELEGDILYGNAYDRPDFFIRQSFKPQENQSTVNQSEAVYPVIQTSYLQGPVAYFFKEIDIDA